MIATAPEHIVSRRENTHVKGKLPEYTIVGAAVLLLFILYASDLSLSRAFIISYTVYTFLRYVNNLGYTVNIFDFLTLLSAIQTLLSPLFAYIFFNHSYFFTRLWLAEMAVPEDVYFNFMIPANLALFAGLHLIFYKRTRYAKIYMERAKAFVQDKTAVGVVFIGIGFVSSFFLSKVPDSIHFIFYLLTDLSYVGGFYVYFSVKKRKNLVILVTLSAFFAQSIINGLFGEFAIYMALVVSLVLAQYRLRFIPKFTALSLAMVAMILIQSIKTDYRNIAWGRKSNVKYAGMGNLEVFSTMLFDRVEDPSTIMNMESGFFLNRRFNQGWLISLAMNYVPRVRPYANGETIWMSVAATLVPRFLWPDKPEAGGRANLIRFAGITRRISFSMNIGPYGEGYGNFGPTGGVVFMLVYGMLLALFLDRVLLVAQKFPSLVIWIPLLFDYVLTVETDILTTLNSFIKSVVFIWVFYWAAKRFFSTDV